ncbi:hypothetical protein BKA69DRAFT_1030461 [Paraphysoderma sedebokerense]|nr:hypothetical protein BKA69DRAFT_1030461 [Paraphysoderma sedebokerense]
MVRLLTHNMLQCHVKNCTNGFPLAFKDVTIENIPQEINPDFLVNMLPKVDYEVLKRVCIELALPQLPEAPPADPSSDQQFLESLHKIMIETVVQSGEMVCPSCGHVYPIRDGIPNMLLNESEV